MPEWETCWSRYSIRRTVPAGWGDAGLFARCAGTHDRGPCGLPESHIARTQNRLGAVGDLQLAQDIADVVAHRFGAQHQPRRDVGIRRSLRDQREDFALALAQLREERRQLR